MSWSMEKGKKRCLTPGGVARPLVRGRQGGGGGAAGIDETAMAHDHPITQSGVDRNAVSGHVHRFDEVRVGREIFHDPQMEVAALALPNTDMLLGADYLRTRPIWVSYTARKLFV